MRALTSSDPATAKIPTILVVDDEREIRDLLVEVLESEGYGVRTADDGVAALKCVLESRPTVVLLDVDMPRLRGTETLLVIRELWPETNVIMISGKADEAEARRALSLGAFDYITKPFDLAYLHRVIEAAV